MVDNQSLRGFLAMVERVYPEELLRIREPVRTHLDITSLIFELEHMGRSPVVIYENVEGHTLPVVTSKAPLSSSTALSGEVPYSCGREVRQW